GQGGTAGAQAAQQGTSAAMPSMNGMQPAAGSATGNQAGTAASPAGQSSAIVRLRDVVSVRRDGFGGVELGAQQYDQSATLDGRPTVALTIFGLPGANALDTAEGIYAKMAELQKRFPEGMEYEIVYDTTPFIRQSVNE